nr:hypothetical protein [Tanacetum cinerariifolium]
MLSDHQRRSAVSNEDRIQKISHSIFLTNFPDSINLCDLWRECSAYSTVVDVFIPLKKSQAGKRECSAYSTVVDVFIPLKKSQAGKRFTFVRFIKVFSLDRLVKNLRTI